MDGSSRNKIFIITIIKLCLPVANFGALYLIGHNNIDIGGVSKLVYYIFKFIYEFITLKILFRIPNICDMKF